MNIYNFKALMWIIRTVLIMGLLSPLNAISRESIGHVIQSIGTLTATSSDGKTRSLRRGSRIKQGDVIKSGRSSIAQLRMNDGALVALRQNTEFRFDKYQYAEDKRTGSSIFSLLKGGFRTITGLIGKYNKKNYRVKTSVATIGVRGTHYGLMLCSGRSCSGPDGVIEDGLYGGVVDGEITTENKAGLYTFSNDEYFHLASETGTPRRLIKPPGVIFGQDKHVKQKKMKDNKHLASMPKKRALQQGSAHHQIFDALPPLPPKIDFIATEDVTSNTYRLPSSKGNVLAYSFFQGVPGSLTSINQTLIDDGTAGNRFFMDPIEAEKGVFIPLKSINTFGAASPVTRELFLGKAQLADVGSVSLPDGTQLSWGRWSGTYLNKVNGTDLPIKGDLHYVVASALTTPAQIGAITGTFNYTTIAGTKATDLNGNIAANVANVSMDIDFFTNDITAFSISTNVGGNVYQADIGTPPIAISSALTNGMTIDGTLLGICSTCVGKATLGLVGKQAEGAITTYTISNPAAANRITGAAILKQQGVVPM